MRLSSAAQLARAAARGEEDAETDVIMISEGTCCSLMGTFWWGG